MQLETSIVLLMEWRYRMDDEQLHDCDEVDEQLYDYYDADYAPKAPKVRRRVRGEWDDLTLMESLLWKSIGIDD